MGYIMNKEVVLRAEGIKKSFGDNHIHTDINFNLYKGECLGLLGGSGTGKSVLLRSLIGLDFIDQGQILFREKRIDHLIEKEMAKIRTKISYSFQTGALFDSLSVFENIAFPLYEHTDLNHMEIKDKISKLLKTFHLEGKEHLMPADLSGGMQKRVGMARSIVLDPDIILFDEPTAGLDPANTSNVVDIMKHLRDEGRTSIFVTHDIPSAIEICNRILIIDNGIIGFEGSINEFQNTTNKIAKQFINVEDH
jgi:phospholipid/cholesterol/gamma-HCH transport system ATP-binding protein